MSVFYNKYWYRTLIDGLLPTLNKDQIYIIIQGQINGSRYFSAFETPDILQRWLTRIPKQYQHFYELIMGENRQKPHFDIDISDMKIDHQSILKLVVDSISDNIGKMGYVLNSDNILVFTSHGREKHSYHVIIDGFYHKNNKEAKEFYFRVCHNLPLIKSKYVDRAVYSSKQNFRLLGSSKEGSSRYKICSSHDQIDLKRTLVSYVDTETNIHLPISIPEIKLTLDKISDSETKKILNMIPDSSNYSYLRRVDSYIILKRERPSYCQICQRIHDAENPYIIVQHGDIFFNCRRNQKSLHLGYMYKSKLYLETNIIKTEPEAYDYYKLEQLADQTYAIPDNHNPQHALDILFPT